MPIDQPFRTEQRRVARRMVASVIVTAAALSSAALFSTGPGMPIAQRLQAVLQLDGFVVAWLAASIANVARLRFFSDRDIAGSGAGAGSQAVRDAVAILQNTLEQVVLAVVTHLAVAASISEPVVVLNVAVALFCVGRALFWIGYSAGAASRALGFALTFYPSVACLAFAVATHLVDVLR